MWNNKKPREPFHLGLKNLMTVLVYIPFQNDKSIFWSALYTQQLLNILLFSLRGHATELTRVVYTIKNFSALRLIHQQIIASSSDVKTELFLPGKAIFLNESLL